MTKQRNDSSFAVKLRRMDETTKGFSLVELLVVVSIIAVLSVSSIVGFGHLGDTLRAREVTGLLSDLIKQEGLKVLRGDFETVTINFLADYVVIEEQEEGASMKLALGLACEDGGYKISWVNSGNLIQKDEDGAIIRIKSVLPEDPPECIDFKGAEEIEWNYQLTDGDRFSNIVRFAHFNLQRENLDNPIFITSAVDPALEIIPSSGEDSRIEITAPYGKKRIYYDDKPVESVDITAEDENGNSRDTLTIR